jgi:predicted dehydrogenase
VSVRTIALLGLGNVAEPHLIAYGTLPQVKVIAAVDPRAERLQRICREHGLQGFASAQELFAELTPDVACILTPTQTHRALVEISARARAHILCEKPMAVTLEDAVAMQEVCAKAGVSFFYGSSYRYLPAIQEAKALIAGGAIGEIRLIVEEMIGGQGAEAYRALSSAHYPQGGPGGGGYGLVDHGIHMLDVFPWLCASPISRVLGRGDRTGLTPEPEFTVMQMSNGVTGLLVYYGSTRPALAPGSGVFSDAREWVDGRGWVGEAGQWDPAPGNIRVYGTQGSLNILHYANKLFLNRAGEPEERRLPAGTAPYHFAAQMQAFCASLDRGGPAPTSASDGIRALRALLAVYASQSSGSWQDVADDTTKIQGPSTIDIGACRP